MSTPYLFDNAVLDRHARLVNRLPVQSELEFAQALVLLASFPDAGVQADDELLDSFLDRKHALASWNERGGVRLGVLIPLTGVALFVWGWTHSSSSPNGATLGAILVVAASVLIIRTFVHWYRRTEREGAAHTAAMESRMLQDTTGDHIWDA